MTNQPPPHNRLSMGDTTKTADCFAVESVAYEHTSDCGIRAIVLRGPYSFCAYVGVPLSHALSGMDDFEIDCHGGITYNAPGKPHNPLQQGLHWFGWDYAHHSDCLINENGNPLLKDLYKTLPPHLQDVASDFLARHENGKRWQLGEVVEHLLDVQQQVIDSTKHAQQITIAALQSKKKSAVVLPSTPAPLFPAKIKKMSRRRQKIAISKRLANYAKSIA